MRNPFKNSCSPIGIDVGWREVRAVQVVRGRGGARIRAAACIGRKEPGAELTAQEVSRVVAALRRQGFAGEGAVACVPAGKTLSGVLELPPRSSGAPLDMIARTELARTSKKELGEIEIEWWELPAPAGGAAAAKNATTNVLAIGCAHADATALLDCLEPQAGGGLDVLALDAAPTALARACAGLLAPFPALTAILYVGHETAQILILSGTTIVYERTVAEAGLRLLSSGIANQLGSDDEVTEYVLRVHGCKAPAPGETDEAGDARALVGAHADALASELSASMTYASRRFDTSGGVGRLLLVGPGAEIPGLSERIGMKAGLETVVARADALCPGTGLDPAVLGPGAVLALGLALHESGGGAR
jgi:Tfp pilus assembly PilM family ATPase